MSLRDGTASLAARLIDLVSEARVYDLGRPMSNGMAQSPNHPPFRHCLDRRHGDRVRADGGSAAADLITTGCHVGTHVDALAHVSHEGRLHGGADAEEAQSGGRFTALGIHELAPYAGRGVLLDIPGLLGVECCDGGREITVAELEAAAERQQTPVRPGDAVLVRSGWGAHFDDAELYGGARSGVPGVGAAGARWLADRGGGPGRRRHPGVRVHPRRAGSCAAARAPDPAGGAGRQHHRGHGPRRSGRRPGARVRARALPPQHRRRHRGRPPGPWPWHERRPLPRRRRRGSDPGPACPAGLRPGAAAGHRRHPRPHHRHRRDSGAGLPAGHLPGGHRVRPRPAVGRPGHRRRRRPQDGRRRGCVRQRRAGPLPRLRRHPSAVHPAPERLCRPGVAGGGRVAGGDRRRPGRRGGRRPGDRSAPGHGRLRPPGPPVGVLRAGPARHLDLRGGRIGRRRGPPAGTGRRPHR